MIRLHGLREGLVLLACTPCRKHENGATCTLTPEYERTLEDAMEIAVALFPEWQARCFAAHRK